MRGNVHLPSNFVRIFVNVQSTFMTADELLQKFDVFFSKVRLIADVFAAFRTFCHASGINSPKLPVHACPGPICLGNICNKRCELQFFSRRKTFTSARSSLPIFLILKKNIKNLLLITAIVIR